VAATALALLIVPVGLDRIWQTFTRTDLPVLGTLARAVSPLFIVNSYGLFAVMTVTRPEIVIEGSADGQEWREYVFRYKPGPLSNIEGWMYEFHNLLRERIPEFRLPQAPKQFA